MKKLASLAVLAALIGGPAAAADLPTRKGPPVAPYAPAPTFSWTGFYIGVNAGYSFSRDGDTRTTGSPAFAGLIAPGFTPDSLSTGRGGFIGGGQIGYNLQSGNFVGGLETDIDWVDQRRSASFTGAVLPAFGTTLTTSASRNLDFLGTFRGRVGVTPFDRALLYVTGGLAYGGVRTSGSVVADAAPALAWSGSTDQIRVGWTLGGGGEYAFTNNITFKAEALYYDLGNTSTSALGNAAVLATPALTGIFYDSQVRTAGVVARGGINFKF